MAEATEAAPAPNLLIVDDTPANLQVLAAMLKEQGFTVRPVPSGELALRAAESEPPDLILLDIMMPEMNGYEVCERLKDNDDLRDIPVIFISALSDTSDKVKAFEVGGLDYVTKPFQFEEVRARVGAHLKLRRLQVEAAEHHRQLEQSYEQLRELEELRDSLMHMIVHDLRTPLTSIITGLETMETLGELDDLQQELLTVSIEGGHTLLGMINDLLDINKMESGQMELERSEVNAAALAQRCVNQVATLAQEKGLELGVEISESLPVLQADEEKLRRTLVNLLGNAIKFTPQGSVTLAVRHSPEDNALCFAVRDTGEGIPEEAFERIFEKFGQVETRKAGRKMSTGLGLTFCKMVAEAHGGRIWVESELGVGSVFSLALPLGKASSQ
ncbi:MAG: hybrid sensor histidine kinase/response regulator [Armatimonadia bacterium]